MLNMILHKGKVMKNALYKASISSIVASILLTVSGCGSSSSNTTPVVVAISHSGTAIDGILVGSTVCIDVNKNNSCDEGEPSAITDSKGKFTIEKTTATGPLLLVGGTDNSTGKAFTGSLKAPAGSTVVTPLTSAVQSLVESGKSAVEAEKAVKIAMGLPDIELTKFDPFESINDANATTAQNAQKILAKQTQLQVLVHTATVTIAGADTGTDVNSTMSSVFDAIASNFDGATSLVTLDSAKVATATKKAADKVYANNQEARVTAKVIAQTSAETAVRDADDAEKTITNASIANAVDQLDAAISKVNSSTEKTLRDAATAAVANVKILLAQNAKALDEIETLQKAQEEKEALIEAAQKAEAEARAEALHAKAESDRILADAQATEAAQKAAYEAQLSAELVAQKAAGEKARADEAAALAQKNTAEKEKAIEAQAAQREAEAQAAQSQAEAEKLAAQVRENAAKKASDDAVSATTLKEAQDAVLVAENSAKTSIAQAEVNANVQVANFFANQAHADANRTKEIADLNITGTLADANATTAQLAALAATQAASDTNISILADNNISASISFKNEAQKQAALAHQALGDALNIKAKVELDVATTLAIQAKVKRITLFVNKVIALESDATKILLDANVTLTKINSDINKIFGISNQLAKAQSVANDANVSTNEAKAAFEKAEIALNGIKNALTQVKVELALYDEVKAENTEKNAQNSFDILREELKVFELKAKEVAEKLAEAKVIENDEITAQQGVEAARIAKSIADSKTTAQARLDDIVKLAEDAIASATAAQASATAAQAVASLNSNATQFASLAQTNATTALSKANLAKLKVDAAANEIKKVFVTNVNDINETNAGEVVDTLDVYKKEVTKAVQEANSEKDAALSNLEKAKNAIKPVVIQGGFVDGIKISGIEEDEGKIKAYQVVLLNNELSETQFILDANGTFVETNQTNRDIVLDSNGSWVQTPIKEAYSITNGVVKFTKSGEEVKIDANLSLSNPTSLDEITLVTKINKLLPGDENITFSAGALAYKISFKNVTDRYSLHYKKTACNDYNQTTNKCNVAEVPYTSLISFVNSGNEPTGSKDTNGTWTGINFQTDGSEAIDINGSIITTLSIGLEGKLVLDKNNTNVVGTWKVINLPFNAGLALLLTPDTAHKILFTYADENLIALYNGNVYIGSQKLGSPDFKVDTNNNMDLNEIAFADIKTFLRDYVINQPTVSTTQIKTTSLLHTPKGVLNGNIMYIANEKEGTIYKIDENGTYSLFLSGYDGASGLVKNLSNNKFYFSDDNNKIYSFDENATVIPLAINAGLLTNPNALEIDNNYLYIANAGSNIVRVNLANLSDILVMVEGLNIPQAVRVSGNDLYFSDNNGALYKVNKNATTTETNASSLVVMNNLFLGGDNQGGIAIDSNQNIYLSNFAGGKIIKVSAPDYNTSSEVFNISGTQPRGLFYRSQDNSLYATIFNEATIVKIDLTTPNPALLFSTLSGGEGPFGIIVDYINASTTEGNTSSGGQTDTSISTENNNTVPTETAKAFINKVETLSQPTKIATVDDAKNMFAQLREAVLTFVDVNNIDTNTSTIIGSQIDTLNQQMKPAVDAIATDFNSSATALQTSVDAFATSLETDMNSTVNTITNRIDALVNQTLVFYNEQNWSVQAGDDNLTRTVTQVNGVDTEVINFNGDVLTIVSRTNSENLPISATGSATITGTNYNLTVSKFTFSNGKVDFSATGEISGANSAKMTLNTLNIVSDINDSSNNIDAKNVGVTFDGTITAGGRTLVGSLTLSETSNSILAGTFTGLSGEPSFDGNITLKTSLNALVNDLNADEISNIGHQLVMVNNADGTQDLVTAYALTQETYSSGIGSNGYTQQYRDQFIKLFTQIGHEIDCSTRIIYGYNDINNTISCEDKNTSTNVTLIPYLTTDGKITATVDGQEKIIGYAGVNYDASLSSLATTTYGLDIGVFTTYLSFINEYSSTQINPNTGSLEQNGQVIHISKLVVSPRLNILDRTFDFAASGSITDGSKLIKASFGINRGIESHIYAKEIEITDGESFVKLAELSLTLTNAEFLNATKYNNQDNYYAYNWYYNLNLSKSIFENYYINYNEFYSSNNNDFKPENILSVKLDNLQVSLYDTANEILTIDSNLSYTHNGDIVTSTFDGKYEYRGTKFVGHIDVNGSVKDLPSGDTEVIGTANVLGSVSANGFEPFGVTVTAQFDANNSMEAYGLFTRGSANYELGIHAVHTENSTTREDVINIGDSNGVVATMTQTDNIGTNQVTNAGLQVKDKDGNDLATYGESTTGNNWEIKYSDNTSETLF